MLSLMSDALENTALPPVLCLSRGNSKFLLISFYLSLFLNIHGLWLLEHHRSYTTAPFLQHKVSRLMSNELLVGIIEELTVDWQPAVAVDEMPSERIYQSDSCLLLSAVCSHSVSESL